MKLDLRMAGRPDAARLAAERERALEIGRAGGYPRLGAPPLLGVGG